MTLVELGGLKMIELEDSLQVQAETLIDEINDLEQKIVVKKLQLDKLMNILTFN